ncbi:hypothetical protein N657DRAFT_614192 [Parathielavia appendiculata]|uniref:Tafazzin n=1 Tax=Parathielavia appendiculata TaxID=2587402 RepID=A0AAN6U509_9PEZI|nr:hypothetical protein N657DRAFT_614192 [Parathielavia appendiculata]
MPKKRHLNKYSKPQSTAPALLSSTAARRNNTHHDDSSRSRGVNELLADLRRTGLSGPPAPDVVQPTIHPSLRHILQIPETPPPRPRRPPIRGGTAGARLPPGPPPPRSWLSRPERAENALRRSAIESAAAWRSVQRPLPGLSLPARGSLIDVVLRRMVLDWEWQRSYCRYHLYELPTHLRVALITYLAAYTDEGVSVRDLQAVLQPPPDVPDYYEDPAPPSIINESFSYLDLFGSIGRSLRLRELSDLLFPREPESNNLQESWDTADASSADIPRPLLPNLTHLSLALDPSFCRDVSWRHLLAFAARLPGLTHLSLAFWPEPTLTPNAKLATVISPQTGRTLQYGGTGPYSHSLDDDWAEQVLVLRRLSRCLYGLEYLDLTGCGAWFPALWASAGEGDTVDWTGAWGKISTVVMYPGYRLGNDAGLAETARYWEFVDYARRVERHVRSCRAGRGRFFSVETCKRPGEL